MKINWYFNQLKKSQKKKLKKATNDAVKLFTQIFFLIFLFLSFFPNIKIKINTSVTHTQSVKSLDVCGYITIISFFATLLTF